MLEPEKVEEISETKTEEIPVAQTETIDIEAAAEKEINVEPIIVDDTFEETIEESVKEETEEINSEEPKHEKIKKPLKESIIETFSKLKNKFIKNKRVKEESIEESNTENKLSEWEDPVEYKYEITDYKTFEKEENKEEYVPKHSETNIDGQISLLENEKESISDASVITTETAKESPTVEKQEETNNLTINEQTPTLKDESEENIEFNQMPLEKYLSDENTILIVVDAENAYCRLFGANAFIEKPIYTISSDSNGNKSYYNRRYIRKIQNRIRNTYGITDEQIKRIDVLIYSILREYDDALWTDKRIESHTAESYVQIMSKDYDRIIGESDMEYLIRSKRVRILTLAKSNIDIEYLTDNIWKFNKLKIKDKFVISKYVKQFEIEDYLKSDFEKQKTKQNIEFYNNIYKATNEFRKHEPKHEQESIKEENQVKEENTEINELDKEEQKLIKKFKKEKARIDRIEKRKERLEIAREKRNKKKAERIKSQQLLKEQREFEKERQREEARIEEELLTDNLYPKTKFNKNL